MGDATIKFHIQTSQTQFRIPSELIRKNYKDIQRLLEKQKKKLSEDVAHIKQNKDISASDKLQHIRTMIKSFESFKKKAIDLANKDEDYRSRLICRLENIMELNQYVYNKSDNSSNEYEEEDGRKGSSGKAEEMSLDLRNPNLITWYRNQTNLLIVDYLIKSNQHFERNIGTALLENLSQSNPKTKKMIDYDLFENFNQVFLSTVKNHDLGPIIQWFNDNKSSLKKLNSNLEFEINYCRFLSLIEEGKVEDAIKFSKTNLSPYGNKKNYTANNFSKFEENLSKLREIGGLLVYVAINPKNISEVTPVPLSTNLVMNSPRFKEYRLLLSNERWLHLSKCFTNDFTRLYGIPQNIPLFIFLSAGLTSLKTKSCYCNTENTIFKSEEGVYDGMKHEEGGEDYLDILSDKKYRAPNFYYKMLNKINNCPVCSPELYELSRNLPYASLITSIFNNPFKLPNGNIYPFDKLLSPSEKKISEKNTLLRMGKIKDPLTKEIFLIDNCVRVFPA